jgi:hypothetical protein
VLDNLALQRVGLGHLSLATRRVAHFRMAAGVQATARSELTVKLRLIAKDHSRPVLLLFEYEPSEVDLLRQACRDLAALRIDTFALHEQPWVRAIADCQFFWRYSAKDIGVKTPLPGYPFVLLYSDEAWLEVEGKLLAVREPIPNHFNELTMEGDVEVIISPDERP